MATTNNVKIPSPEQVAGMSRADRITLSNKLRDAGMAWAAVRSVTKLNHVVSELEYMRHTLPADQRIAATSANAKMLRNERQLSWGEIAVRLNTTEGRARKLYAEGSGTLSEGQRIGKGGRWLNNDSELYADVLQPTGTVIPVAAGRRNARTLAAQQRITKMDPAALKQFAADNGVAAKGKTPAQIAKALYAKLGLDKLEAAGTAATAAPAKAEKVEAAS